MKRQIFIILFSIFRRRFHNETIDFQKNENVNIPICKCLNFTNCKGRKTTWKTRLNFDFKIIIVQMFRERNLQEVEKILQDNKSPGRDRYPDRDHELSEEDKLKVTRAGDREIPLIPFQVG